MTPIINSVDEFRLHKSALRIVMLARNGLCPRIIYNGIASDFAPACLIVEPAPSRKQLLTRRLKRLGLFKVGGQGLLLMFRKWFLSRKSEKRMRELIVQYQLSDTPFPSHLIRHVRSVNDQEAIGELKKLQPDVVLVVGTSILSEEVLTSIDAPFINTHTGITPRYRGCNGAYWALAKQDRENCGVTVHLVDGGIDTGGVLYQDRITVGPGDDMETYLIHQMARAIPLLKSAINDVRENRITVRQGVYPSCFWTDPTLFEYVKNWVRTGVR